MGMRLPVVAIVGRPNVGKSTLFNRIVGKRLAIVHEQEGITRDRMAREAEWTGHSFMLVDTGGYIPKGGDIIDKEVKKQALQAVEEADVILLMVDTRIGITAEDESIARVVLRSGKPFLVLANKADNEILDRDTGIFHRMGVKTIYPISGLNGRRIGDMLDAVVAHFDAIELENESEDAIRFAVVGMPNAGKSSLTNALLGRDQQIVTNIPGTTRDAIDTEFTYYGQRYVMVDTAGLRRRAKINDSVEYFSSLRTQQAIRSAEVVVALVDAEKGFAVQDARVMEEVIRKGKGLIVAVNKWDLVPKTDKTMKAYTQSLIDELFVLRHYPILFISTTERRRIFKVVETVKEIHAARQERIGTRALNLFLEDVQQRKQPPAVQGRELKLNYISQVRTAPPLIIIHSNHPTLIPTSYKRYLENRFRETFGFRGVPLSFQFRQK